MHILMLDQHFAAEGGGAGKRFFEIGPRLVERGHDVTVISGNSGLGLPLGNKRIGLLQRQGMAIVAFNQSGRMKEQTGSKEEHREALSFARFAAGQGRRLPRPDLVLAASPPLEASKVALSLSSRYGALLVMDIREAEPSLQMEGAGRLSLFIASFRRRSALKSYVSSAAIITTGEDIADLIRESASIHGRIGVIPESAAGEELFEAFMKLLQYQIQSL